MHNWENAARDGIRNFLDNLATTVNISRFDAPIFLFSIIVLILMQILGWKLDKPILNIISMIIAVFFLVYFGII